MEREAALKHSIKELEAKNKEALHLNKQVKELEDKLQEAKAKMKVSSYSRSSSLHFLEKVLSCLPPNHVLQVASSAAESKDSVEVNSRDIDGLTFSTPTKRTSKKKSETASVQVASSSSSATHTEASPLANIKFVFGVALVSAIIGVILGKSY